MVQPGTAASLIKPVVQRSDPIYPSLSCVPSNLIHPQQPTIKSKRLKGAKIVSLSSGRTYTHRDKITFKADYDRSHKVDFVPQQKRGSRFETLTKAGNGNFGQLQPGTYRVAILYANCNTLPVKWIVFKVAGDKQLKGPPPAKLDLDKNSSSAEKHFIDLKQ